MGIVRRAASERGHINIGWLESRHSFSFGQYYDPRHMGYRTLRVINEDRVRPGEGFGRHGHRDMEIVSYVVSGNLAHADTLGSRGELKRGDVQAMSAGTGIEHSEFNGSDVDDVHFLQIWILPGAPGLPTAYAQTHVPDDAKRNRLKLLVSPDGADASLRINQDARLYASLLAAGKSLVHRPAPGRGSWVQVISGRVEVNGQMLLGGDGAAVDDVADVTLAAAEDTELLLFDLA
ncbi:MAG: pirin family protein [Rhodospirillaceae bacterium]|nr:pirin family protein [Rhodospirillaceae bacterium]